MCFKVEDDERKIISKSNVSSMIDFGTTFSGAGYVFINNANVDNINDICRWYVR